MSAAIVTSAQDFISRHPGCSHTELENHLIFEKMSENREHSGFGALSSNDFTEIERLADELIQ